MSLLDLRAYFQRAKSEPCRNEQGGRRPGQPLGYLCTLPKGHDGSHVAHDLDGSLITRWPA